MGVRRLNALANALPKDSALAHSIEPRTGTWSNEAELLKAIAELIDQNNRLFISANSKKGTQQPKPIEIPRPWEDDKPRRRAATSQEMAKFFKGHSTYVPPEKGAVDDQRS